MNDKGKKDNLYLATIRIDSDELNEIFEKLHEAEETIQDCYYRLRELGVVVIRGKDAASGD